MKALTALSLLQTACLVLLLLRTSDGGAPATSAAPVTVPHEALVVQPADTAAIRRILREELARLSSTTAAAPAPGDVMRNRAQHERVAEQLAYYRSVGEISPPELDALSGEIGKLDEAARRELFRELTQALNRGEIKGLL